MTIATLVPVGVMGYLLGCIQTAYIVGRRFGRIDIREHGSSNAGASNITQVMGWKYGVLTAVVDILKAVLAVIIARLLFPDSDIHVFVAGVLAVIGHIFPVFLKFRGGKGAASLIGMMLAFDFRIGLVIIAAIVILAIIVDYIAIGTIAMYALIPVLTYILDYPIACTVIGALLAVIGILKHRINIRRILKHEEKGLRTTLKKRKGLKL